jgi:hypothetical protein
VERLDDEAGACGGRGRRGFPTRRLDDAAKERRVGWAPPTGLRLFRSLAAQHPVVDVWADAGIVEDVWSYFWIVSEFAPGSIRNLAYVRLKGDRLDRRTYDEAGDDLWVPVE